MMTHDICVPTQFPSCRPVLHTRTGKIKSKFSFFFVHHPPVDKPTQHALLTVRHMTHTRRKYTNLTINCPTCWNCAVYVVCHVCHILVYRSCVRNRGIGRTASMFLYLLICLSVNNRSSGYLVYTKNSKHKCQFHILCEHSVCHRADFLHHERYCPRRTPCFGCAAST